MKRTFLPSPYILCGLLFTVIVSAFVFASTVRTKDSKAQPSTPSSDFIIPQSEPIKQARLLIEQSRLTEAETILLREEASGDALDRAQASCSLAETLIRSGNYQQAEDQLAKCKETVVSISPNAEMEAYAHHLSGFLAQMTGRYTEAIVNYEKALIIESQLRDESAAPSLNTMNNLGNVYYRLGQYDLSEQLHLEVLAGRRELFGESHPKVAASLGNLGNTYEAQGRPLLGLEYHEKALIIWRNSFGDNDLQTSYSLNNIGVSALKIGDLDRAIPSLFRSYEIKKSILGGNSPDIAGTLYNLANAHLSNKQLRDAEEYATEAIRIYDYLNLLDLPKYSMALATLALIHLKKGSAIHARQIAESELTRISGTSTPSEILLLNVLAKICLTQSDFVCAMHAADKAVLLNTNRQDKEPILALSLLQQSASKEKLVESLLLKAQALAAQAETTDSLSLLRAAFDTFDAALAFSHVALSTANSNRPAFEPMAHTEEAMVQFIRSGLKLLSARDDANLASRLFNIIDVHNGGVLLAGMRFRHSQMNSISSLITQYDSISPIDIRPGNSLIEFVELDAQLWVMVVNKSGYHFRNIGLLNEAKEVADSLSFSILKRDLHGIHHHASQGYDFLIAPLEGIVKDDDLVFIPSSTLKLVPFEVLIPSAQERGTPEAQMRPYFLIEDRQVSYGYSAALLELQSRSKKSQFEKTLLAIAPVFDQDSEYSPQLETFLEKYGSSGKSLTLAPLPGSAEEVIQIGKTLSNKVGMLDKLKGNSVDVLLRNDSKEHSLKAKNLSEYRYLHFATHSFVDKANSDSSGIVLETSGSNGQDGILYAAEVFDLDLNAELVVLSSCDSGVDASSTSFELAGFAKGFIHAGAQNLVASIWPSDDVGTQILMQRFYLHLASGSSSSEALRLAKLDLIEMGGPIANPYYWGGFIHLGAPDTIATRASDRMLPLN